MEEKIEEPTLDETVELDLDKADEIDYKAKFEEMEDKYLRAHAEFENTKKRLEKEKYNAIDYAVEKFAKDLLGAIDSLEMAISSSKGDAEPAELLHKMREGIDLTIKQFVTAFEKNNMEKIDTDCEFDPHVHNAVMHIDSEAHEEGQIVATLQTGYKIRDRVLRPSMVSICKKN